MDLKELWKNALSQIELLVSKAIFTTWFKDTHVVRFEDGAVFIGVQNEFTREWLSNKHHKLILKTLRDLSDSIRSVEYVISRGNSDKKTAPLVIPRIVIGSELPLNDLYINKEDNLNPRYTFDSFVVGSFNQLAYAASQAIIKNLGRVYNPLFVYGKTGHGKTHLIQAIGNAVKSTYPGKKVFYVTSEQFSQDYINCVQTNKMASFKEKYRKYDVIIMDDIQFLSNKERTQEELFHLFNALYDTNKQIVFSSDQHPNYIPGLEERLKSRFGAGMTADIPSPDHESRTAILKAKSIVINFPLSEEVCDYLAATIDGNIRELEGALNTVICQAQIKGRELTLAEAKEVIKDSIKPRKMIPVKDVVRIIAEFYNIEEESIYKKTRKKEVVKPRQIIMYILRHDFNIPYPTIGQRLGGRDHTTVIHSYEKIKNDILRDHTLAQEINRLRTMM